MYGNIYQSNSGSSAILDNRKFIKPNALVYEAAPNIIKYDEDSLDKKLAYSYGQPDNVMNDAASFSFNQFGQDALSILKKLKGEPSTSTKDIVEGYSNQPKSDENEAPLTNEDDSPSSCGLSEDGVTNICGAGNLFPIMDPRFNLREAAKNMILLEDHLFHQGKRCQDCILKHCLTIEGFLEEGITLDKTREYSGILNDSLSRFREVFRDLADKIKKRTLQDEDCCQFAQRIRVIRKPLCQQFATFLQ